jgi:hypothetical protein
MVICGDLRGGPAPPPPWHINNGNKRVMPGLLEAQSTLKSHLIPRRSPTHLACCDSEELHYNGDDRHD